MSILESSRTVALVGRPNVGKSRLFNRLTGRRLSIVHDQPGVTRDVISAEVGDAYCLLDTGGIGMDLEQTPQRIAPQIHFIGFQVTPQASAEIKRLVAEERGQFKALNLE